jgi:ABC-type dipeptide/oligopeptide/nickel transport system permease subunit
MSTSPPHAAGPPPAPRSPSVPVTSSVFLADRASVIRWASAMLSAAVTSRVLLARWASVALSVPVASSAFLTRSAFATPFTSLTLSAASAAGAGGQRVLPPFGPGRGLGSFKAWIIECYRRGLRRSTSAWRAFSGSAAALTALPRAVAAVAAVVGSAISLARGRSRLTPGHRRRRTGGRHAARRLDPHRGGARHGALGPRNGTGRLRVRRRHDPLPHGRVRILAGLGFLLSLLVLAFAGPYLTRWSWTDVDLGAFREPPSASHWLGTTQTGRDVYAVTLRGMRVSLLTGLLVAVSATGLAAVAGTVAGYFGGWTDRGLTSVIDLMLVLPPLLVVATVSPALRGSDLPVLAPLLAAFMWMVTARVVRGMTISLRDRDYVLAARYLGVGAMTIIRRHIVPNLASLLIVDATLNVSTAVIGAHR